MCPVSRAPSGRSAVDTAIRVFLAWSAQWREGRRAQEACLLHLEQAIDHLQIEVPARVGHHAVPPRLAVIKALIAPQCDNVIELAALGREVTEELAQQLDLDRQSVLLIQSGELGELAGFHAVVALLDDHLTCLPSLAAAAGTHWRDNVDVRSFD